jgi:signal transduction histidine kinase
VHLTTRARLTLLYTSVFAACGLVLVFVTYLLVAHNLNHTTTTSAPAKATQAQIAECVNNLTGKSGSLTNAKQRCTALFSKGVQTGATAQRSGTLHHLLLYSLLSLAGVTLLAAVAGWFVAGRILRPIQQLTTAARAASGQHLSHRLALTGPRDELRELADTFDSMLARLEASFTSQRQFIANASHELRTPLTLMRTSIDVVLGKPNPTPEELVSMSADVRQAVDQAERLIDALLTLARNEQARAVSDPLDLATIAEDALDTRQADGITTLSTLNQAPVTGDGILLERLISNLLDNAEQYNYPGGTVSIATASDNGSSVLRVVNTGTVVPAEQVERLFLPFTRLDDRTRHDGFGLGLALVRSITAIHGGTVNAVAVPTGGLDITVRFPRRDADVADGSPKD